MKALTLRLDDEIYEELKKVAENEDRSINNAIIQAIRDYLKKKSL